VGRATPGIAAFPYNLRFPGQYYQTETGLSQNRFRDYDPVVGKYIESDPLGLRAGLNTYSYAGASPLLRVDPRGLDYWVQDSGPTQQFGLHQAICVGKPDGHPFCISFAALSRCVANCQGQVYEDSDISGLPNSAMYRITSSDTDAKVATLFNQLIGTTGNYSVFGSSCRNFSQRIFNELVIEYGGALPDPDIPVGP
jgi:RHS repeat-associated protein